MAPMRNAIRLLEKKEDVDALWDYVRDGSVDFIGSDRATYTVAEKESGKDDIFVAPSGFLGVDPPSSPDAQRSQ